MRNYLLFVICYLLFFTSCSSAPKKPPEVFADRNTAANQLNLANLYAARGRYDDALRFLDEARRLALSTDDPSLRIKTAMSRGSILFSLGRHDEAFSVWEDAHIEGDVSGEPVLAAQVRIYVIRARLVLLANESEAAGSAQNQIVDGYKSRLQAEMATVRSDPLSVAAGYVTLGFAEKQLRRWAEAEAAIKQALAIHEKDYHLEDAAYDWYVIASVRSVAGNYSGALDALWMAIGFDRRAENGFGLASSWQAMGDVHLKTGNSAEASSAYRRAADIYKAIGLTGPAEKP